MKSAINNQSKNEVKDLLYNYVVSPLNKDISESLSKMSEKIESLEESTKDINHFSSSVNRNISRLKSLLDNSFHFDEEEDAFDKLCDTIEDGQEIITERIDQNKKELSDIISSIQTVIANLRDDLQEADKRTNEATKKNKQELTASISKQFKELEDFCQKVQSESDASKTEIKTELSHLQTKASNEFNSLSEQIKESYERNEKQSSDIQCFLNAKLKEIELLITENNEGLTKRIDTNIQTVSDDYTKQSAAISSYHEETKTAIDSMRSQQQLSIEKKYKIIFTLSLSFGIVNVVGLIAVIVLLLIK